MNGVSDASRARAAAAFLALAAAGVGVALVDWAQNEKPAALECMVASGYASPEAQAAFGIDAGGQWGYLHATQCYEAGDAGAVPALPGVEVLRATEKYVPDIGKKLKVRRQGEADGFPCACAPRTTGCMGQTDAGYASVPCAAAPCYSLLADGGLVQAPPDTTLEEGKWQGAGCVPKTCVEWAGASSMPAACR
jgi:hypothetical protein